jgi:hypothetical protein
VEHAGGWWRRLTPRHLILLVPWIGIVRAAAKAVSDNSFLWHVRAGSLQLDLGHVLTTDPFSFTMQGAPWRTQSWLIELGYGLLERWTGGLVWVRFELVVVAGLTYILLTLVLYRKSRNLLATGLLMVMFTWLAVAFEVPRPVVFTGLFLAMLVAMLDEDMLWPVPLLMWVWASVHGAWIIGIGYVVVHSLATKRPVRRAAGTVGVSLLAVTVTAQGFGVWEILWAFLRNRAALSFISEWAIPNVLSIQILPYDITFLLLMVAAVRGRFRLRLLWIIVPFFVFGLSAGRNLYPAMIVLLPTAVLGWPKEWRWRRATPSRREGRLNLVVAALLLAVPLALLLTAPSGVNDERFPVFASRYLGSEHVFSDDGSGGYLIYAQWPEREVFIDDRAELYGAELMKEFVAARNGTPEWRDLFAEYGIGQALLQSDEGLVRALREAGWVTRYEDADWVLLEPPLTD